MWAFSAQGTWKPVWAFYLLTTSLLRPLRTTLGQVRGESQPGKGMWIINDFPHISKRRKGFLDGVALARFSTWPRPMKTVFIFWQAHLLKTKSLMLMSCLPIKKTQCSNCSSLGKGSFRLRHGAIAQKVLEPYGDGSSRTSWGGTFVGLAGCSGVSQLKPLSCTASLLPLCRRNRHRAEGNNREGHIQFVS